MAKSYEEQTEEEYQKIIRDFRRAGVLALILLGSGATFFHFVQKLSWLDAFYFCTISLATVGYGDIVPTTPVGKIFMIFYVIFGIGIIATFANLLVKRAVVRRELKRVTSKEHDRS